MLEISMLELFLRTIPESFLLVFAVYVISGDKIKRNKYIISSCLLAIIVFFVRRLPINYGVHTIINIMMLILVMIKFGKVDIGSSVKGGLIGAVLLSISEGINMLIIQGLFAENVNNILSNAKLKTIYGVPSLVIFAFIIGIYYVFKLKKGIKQK